LAVLEYLAGLLRSPFRPALDDHSGVFSIPHVPGTTVGMVRTLDLEGHRVVLAYIGL
jgi:hypothetical protein